MSDADLRAATLERHLAAENTHDVDGIVHTFAEDGVLVLNGGTFRGREMIRKAHERFGFSEQGAFSALRVRETHRHTASGAIVLEEEVTGRHNGVWEGIRPTGRPVRIAICTVYEFNSAGELASERVYFDGDALLKQLRNVT